MLSNDLCPSCCRIAGKLISAKILDYHPASINQPSDLLNVSQSSDCFSRKCSGCDKFFSSMVQETQTRIDDGYNDQFNDDSRRADCYNSDTESNSDCDREKSPTIKHQVQPKVISDQVTSFDGEETEVSDGMEDCSQLWSSFSSFDQLKARNRAAFANWIYPTYSRDTLQKVPINEVIEKIKNNFDIDKSLERLYICRIDHDCKRSYKQAFSVKNHLFSVFFFFNCPNCSSIFTYPPSLKNHLKICRTTPKSDGKLTRRKRSILDDSNSSNRKVKRRYKSSKDQSLSTHEESSNKELANAVNILENLMHGVNESIEMVPGQSENTNSNQSIISSYEILDTHEHDESSMLQSDGNVQSDCETKAKLTRKSLDNSKVYRCPFCEYQCKPGGKAVILNHLNGRKLKGKIMAPACTVRKELKPADPKTGLFERLEPTLVVESEETLIKSNESFNKLTEKTC